MQEKRGKRKNKVIQKLRRSKYSPVHWMKKEEDRTIYEASTGRIKRQLTRQQALGITLMAITSAFISAYIKLMQTMRFSTFPDNSIFISWHPYAAPLALIGTTLFIVACYAKGVDFWLVYFGACMGIFYWTIELCMVHSFFTPQDLANFFSMLGELPEWITGPRI